jgi:FtsP/CotA-like multicopper oxidase with cupredoxin domain
VTTNPLLRPVSRRGFLAGGAGLIGAAAVGYQLMPASAAPTAPVIATPGDATAVTVHLVGTDGWVSMPSDAPADSPFFPDSLAPAPFNTYCFGFRNVTGFSPAAVAAERGKAEISAPMMFFDEEDEIFITLTNLGLSQRPDLFDGHTLHWHGFVNAIPLFDGVPELSLAVPVGRDFTYYYKPHDAGTYMYHCHFEDVEHVQMGMTGMVFVRPKQNQIRQGVTTVNPAFAAGAPTPWPGTIATTIPPGRYAYNDYDGSTGYDRNSRS